MVYHHFHTVHRYFVCVCVCGRLLSHASSGDVLPHKCARSPTVLIDHHIYSVTPCSSKFTVRSPLVLIDHFIFSSALQPQVDSNCAHAEGLGAFV